MSNLSENIGTYVLRRRRKHVMRNKSVQNFEIAERAMIVFDASLPNCFPAIKDFTKFLTENKIRNSVLGFIDQKEVPQDMLLWPNFDFLTKRDINWYRKPISPVAEMFLSEEPDILLVLNQNKLLPLEYLAQLSKAKFKVGCFTESMNDYDLMINPSGDNCDTAFFIEQVKHYVQLLNPSK